MDVTSLPDASWFLGTVDTSTPSLGGPVPEEGLFLTPLTKEACSSSLGTEGVHLSCGTTPALLAAGGVANHPTLPRMVLVLALKV